MAVITISGQFGCGARSLGKKLAESLGYVFADSEIITRIAQAANVSEAWVEHVEKEAGGKFLWIVTQMASKDFMSRILSDDYGYIDESVYLDYLVVLIAQFAEENNVVIMERGSQYILHDHPDAVHVLLVDSMENRIQRVMKLHQLSHKKAAQEINRKDKRRAALYKKIGKTNFEQPEIYDMVINLERIDEERAISMIVNLAADR